MTGTRATIIWSSLTEREMIDLVCKNFEKVVLVYNGTNAFELGFVNDYPQIKSVLWTAGQGHIGMKALGKLLNGEVNPSGKMIDTYVSLTSRLLRGGTTLVTLIIPTWMTSTYTSAGSQA